MNNNAIKVMRMINNLKEIRYSICRHIFRYEAKIYDLRGRKTRFFRSKYRAGAWIDKFRDSKRTKARNRGYTLIRVKGVLKLDKKTLFHTIIK